MTTQKLADLMGKIDPAFVEEAGAYNVQKPQPARGKDNAVPIRASRHAGSWAGTVAAVLLLALSISAVTLFLHNKTNSGPEQVPGRRTESGGEPVSTASDEPRTTLGTMREVQDTKSASWLEGICTRSAGPNENVIDFKYALLYEKEDFIVFQCNYVLYGYDLTNKTTTFCIDMMKATDAGRLLLTGGSSRGIRVFFARNESKILLVLNHGEAITDANQNVTGINEVVEATCLIDFQKRNVLKQSSTVSGQNAVYEVSQQIAPLYEAPSDFQGFLGFEDEEMITGNLFYQLDADQWYPFSDEPRTTLGTIYTMDLGGFASAGVEQLLETEETLYYLCSTPGGESRLYFSDKSNKEWLPLCGKPNCLHRTEDCESVLEGNAYNKVWLYGSHIYYIVRTEQSRGPELWRMKLDGSAHEKLCAPFEYAKNTGAMYSYDWYFHNKYAIVLYHTLDSEKAGGQTQAYKLDLGAEKFEAVKLEIPEGVSLGNPIAGRGNMLFCVCGDDDKPSLVKTDLDSGETQILFELPFMPDLYSYAFHDGGIIFAEGWEQGKIFRFDVESGVLETLASAEPETRRWYYPSGKYVFGSNPGSVSPFAGTEISDLSGNLVWESKPSDGGPEIRVGTMIGNYIFGYENGENRITIEHLPTWYLDLREIGTDSFGWHRWGND